jgi:hypothetical protein
MRKPKNIILTKRALKPMPRANNSHDRTFANIGRAEKETAKRVGIAFTDIWRPVALKYARDLEAILAHERTNYHGNSSDKDIWKHFESVPDWSIALMIVAHGLHAGLRRRVKKRRIKYKPSPAPWYNSVGLELGFEKGGPELVAGMWASKLLTRLEPFELSDDGWIRVKTELPELQEMLSGTLSYLAARRPQLLPLKEPKAWDTSADVFTDDTNQIHIGDPSLVTHHPSVAGQLGKDIAAGDGGKIIASLNWMQQTPFMINKPILRLLDRQPPKDVREYDPIKPEIWHPDKDGNPVSEKHHKARERAWMRAHSKWLNWHWNIQEGRLVCDYENGEFYNLLKLDFRFRLVVMQSFAYQGADAARALFLFKNGAEIGEDRHQYSA